jgi:serine/threonine protein kinase
MMIKKYIQRVDFEVKKYLCLFVYFRSFGCVLYKLLTGQRVFSDGETTFDIQNKIIDPMPVDIPAKIQDEKLVTVLKSALEKDPKKRGECAYLTRLLEEFQTDSDREIKESLNRYNPEIETIEQAMLCHKLAENYEKIGKYDMGWKWFSKFLKLLQHLSLEESLRIIVLNIHAILEAFYQRNDHQLERNLNQCAEIFEMKIKNMPMGEFNDRFHSIPHSISTMSLVCKVLGNHNK